MQGSIFEQNIVTVRISQGLTEFIKLSLSRLTVIIV